MAGRIDSLFPHCCYACEHHAGASGTCEHELSQLLRREFAHDADRPCPVAREGEGFEQR